MAGHGAKLPRKKELGIAALLEHPTIEAAAAAIGVNEKTLRGWMSEPSFRDIYRQARTGVLERTVARLLSVCGKAVESLERNLDGDNPHASIRAAVAILDHAVRGVELMDVVQRLTQLEERWAKENP